MGFRKVGDRIITEEQHRSEEAFRGMAMLAVLGVKITAPFGIFAAILTFFSLPFDGWFIKLFISALAGMAVFVFFFPALFLLAFGGLMWIVWELGGFG